MGCLICETHSIQSIYPFITPIGIFIQAIGYATMKGFYHQWLFFSNLIFLSEFTCGLLTFITKINMKNAKQDFLKENPNFNANNLVSVKKRKVKWNYHLLFLAIPAFFDLLQYNILSLHCAGAGILLNALQEDVKNAKILLCLIFCIIFLRTPIYKHQTIAIIITVSGMIINVIFICFTKSASIYQI